MKNFILYTLFFVILFLHACSSKFNYGLYKYEDPFIGEYLTVNSDSTFSFEFVYSMFSDSISGIYTKHNDTLIFNSIDAYKPKILIENSSDRSSLIFKDKGQNGSIPGVSCIILLSDGTKLELMSDFDGLVSVDIKEKFYIECSFPGMRTVKEEIDISEHSNITIWLEIANLGEGMRKFTNEKYIIKGNKLICIEDSINTSYKYKR